MCIVKKSNSKILFFSHNTLNNSFFEIKVKETGIWTEISWRNQLSYIKIYAYGSHDFYLQWNSGQAGNRSSSQRFGDSNHRFHP
jgi:hypothetical protein